MRQLLTLLLLSVPALAWPGGYATFFTVTVNPGQVPSPVTNYTMYFAGDARLKGIASGGCSTSASGYDIIFAADPQGTMPYSFELVGGTYNSLTGSGEWHIGPLSSIATGTMIYGACGNSGVNSFQGGLPGAAWASSFELVQHFQTSSSLSLADSTANPLTATNSGATAAAGKLGGGAGFNGSQYYVIGNAAKTNNWTQQTVSFWMNCASSIAAYGRLVEKGQNNEWTIVANDGSGADCRVQVQNLASTSFGIYSMLQYVGSWHKVDVTMSNISPYLLQLYIDGALIMTSNSSSNASATNHDINVGRYGGGGANYAGALDELTIANTTRTSAWITTAFNNESAPASFYTLGSFAAPTSIHHRVISQ